MIRAFSGLSVDASVLESILANSLKAPSAGHTAAVEFLLLEGPKQVDQYWNITLPPQKRSAFRWQQLLDAPVLVMVMTRPDAYPERYGEPDKAHADLSLGTERWSIPYWYVDAGCVIQNLLLAVTDAGLGACLFGLFEHETAVAHNFGVPDDVRIIGTIAIGHPLPDEFGRSATRQRPGLAEVLHRQRW